MTFPFMSGDMEDSDDIDFGDEISFLASDSDNIDDYSTEPLQLENSDLINTIATGEEALSPLENIDTLNTFFSELEEIHSFLTFRRSESVIENATDIYLSRIVAYLPEEILQVNVSIIDTWLEKINAILSALKDTQKIQLVKITSSPEFVNDVVSQLESRRQLEEKYTQLKNLMGIKREENILQAQNAQNSLDIIIDSAKHLQTEIEQDLSKKYNNREVYIMGEINSVLYGN